MNNETELSNRAHRIGRFVVVIVILAIIAVLIGVVFTASGNPTVLISDLPKWFDPAFFQYNFLMTVFVVCIVPIITYVYVTRMGSEKLNSLKRQLPTEDWENSRGFITDQIEKSFNLRHYIGSMFIIEAVILFGVSILLLFKPLPLPVDGSIVQTGVDFRLGANFLMLGPHMLDYVHNNPIFHDWLMITLIAFQFGFAGALIYFLTHLVRSYFTLDLSPNVFVASSVRMIMGSVISVIAAFFLVDFENGVPVIPMPRGEISIGWLPALCFMIGHFPDRSLMWMNKIVSNNFGIGQPRYGSIRLELLAGMSHSHELRLRREGFDNVDNIVHLDCLDLAVRTGFSYRQLLAWRGEAWLRMRMRADFDEFRMATGIANMNDLSSYLDQYEKDEGTGTKPDWGALLTVLAEDKERIVNKVDVLSRLVHAAQDNLPKHG